LHIFRRALIRPALPGLRWRFVALFATLPAVRPGKIYRFVRF